MLVQDQLKQSNVYFWLYPQFNPFFLLQIPVINIYMRISCFFLLFLTLTTAAIISQDSLSTSSPLTLAQLKPLRRIDDIFSRLPSLQELDQLVLAADSVAILKTIQQVASNGQLDCKFKVSYLMELEGRMRTAIYKKSLLAEQLKIVIAAAQSQVARLKLQNQKLRTEKRLLFLDEKKFSISIHIKDTEALYKQYNSLNIQIEDEKKQLQLTKKDRTRLQTQAQAARQQLTYLKLEFAEVEAKIKVIGPNQKVLQEQKSVILAQINKLQKKIENLQLKILDIKRTEVNIERKIEGLRKQLDSVQTKYLQLEVMLNKYRDEIAVGQAKEDEINIKLATNEDKIVGEEKKILRDELNNIIQMVKSIQNQLPGLLKQIDLQYYLCFVGPNNIKAIPFNATFIFIFNGSEMKRYVTNAYEIPFQLSREQFSLTSLNIFSQNWNYHYGAPFETEQTLADDPASQLTIISDFFCLNPASTLSGLGQILEIKQRTIVIKDASNIKYYLILGSCSRLECSNCVDWAVPVGSKIIWRGQIYPQNEEYVQLYAGTIY